MAHRRAREGEAPGSSLRRVLPAVWSAIDGGRSPKLKLDSLANPVEKSRSNYFAIQQGRDALQIG